MPNLREIKENDQRLAAAVLKKIVKLTLKNGRFLKESGDILQLLLSGETFAANFGRKEMPNMASDSSCRCRVPTEGVSEGSPSV